MLLRKQELPVPVVALIIKKSVTGCRWPLGWLVVVRLAEENYVSSTAGGLISLVNDLMF